MSNDNQNENQEVEYNLRYWCYNLLLNNDEMCREFLNLKGRIIMELINTKEFISISELAAKLDIEVYHACNTVKHLQKLNVLDKVRDGYKIKVRFSNNLIQKSRNYLKGLEEQ